MHFFDCVTFNCNDLYDGQMIVFGKKQLPDLKDDAAVRECLCVTRAILAMKVTDLNELIFLHSF